MSTELTTAHYAPITARKMGEAALRFLDALDDGQRRPRPSISKAASATNGASCPTARSP